ncbi:hypothetical protein EJ110_NYTH52081 [Nymphaea thermarum]|nr:hypothetical protein EJ110_NYTH52081 [Nymphaea thermarum]
MPAIEIDKQGSGVEFEAKFTFYLFLCYAASWQPAEDSCWVMISASLHEEKEDNYCKYDNQYLQLFTSSLYKAALVFTFFASYACKRAEPVAEPEKMAGGGTYGLAWAGQ